MSEGERFMSTRFLTATSRLAALLLLSFCMQGVALADDADPPGRVARLSYVQGAVSLQPAGVDDWAAAAINRPLTTGDKLWTDQDSRAGAREIFNFGLTPKLTLAMPPGLLG